MRGRSQMAEAFVNKFIAEQHDPIRGLSAGTDGGRICRQHGQHGQHGLGDQTSTVVRVETWIKEREPKSVTIDRLRIVRDAAHMSQELLQRGCAEADIHARGQLGKEFG